MGGRGPVLGGDADRRLGEHHVGRDRTAMQPATWAGR